MNNYNELLQLLDSNLYISKCLSNKKKDKTSLSYLISCREMSQSDCIKLGNAIENYFIDIILHYNINLKNIKEKNKKGKKETDHLFRHNEFKKIYYAELKSNINLDTEKSKATIDKIKKINDILQTENKEYEIVPMLVCTRYLTNKDIPIQILKKYDKIKDNILIIGTNEYFQQLCLPVNFTNKQYIMFINDIVKKCLLNNFIYNF